MQTKQLLQLGQICEAGTCQSFRKTNIDLGGLIGETFIARIINQRKQESL